MLEEGARVAGLGQERLLDLGRDPHLLLHPRLLHRFAIEPGVLDRDRRFGGQRLERAAGRAREERALLAAVEIEHADAPLARRRRRPLDRRSAPASAARTGRCGCRARRCPCGRWPARRRAGRRRSSARRCGTLPRESCGWSRRCVPGSVCWRRAARQLELELAVGGRQHDEAALGAGDLDRRIQHQRQHVVEHAAAAERAQAVEQRRDLAQVADRGRGRLVLGRPRVSASRNTSSAPPAAPEPDAVAVRRAAARGDRLAVDVGAVAGLLVADQERRCSRSRSRRGRATPRCRPAADRWSRGGRCRTLPWRSGRSAGRARR